MRISDLEIYLEYGVCEITIANIKTKNVAMMANKEIILIDFQWVSKTVIITKLYFDDVFTELNFSL